MKKTEEYMFEIDMDKASREILVAGDYELTVTGAEQTEAKTTGNPQLKVDLKVLDGTYEGTDLTQWLPLTDRALFMTVPILRGMGLKMPEGGQFSLTAEDLVGKTFRGTITIEQWDGEDRNKLKVAKPSDKKFSKAAINSGPF